MAVGPSGFTLPALLRVRDAFHAAIRDFFRTRGYLEVDTPLLVVEAGTDPHLEPLEVLEPGYTGPPRHLVTSPELAMKRLLAAGAGPIFQLGHVFRGGERGPLHSTEFGLLEWYRPGSDYMGLVEETTALLRHLVEALGLPWVLEHRGRRVDLSLEPEILTVRQAFRRHTASDPPDPGAGPAQEEAFFRTMVERIEPNLGVGRPCFLVDYPASLASLARLKPGDPSVAERAELYLAGVELSNGFSELVDPAEQRARMVSEIEARRAAGLPQLPLPERFLGELGRMPEAAGNALGTDRLLVLLTGASDISEVVPFAREQAGPDQPWGPAQSGNGGQAPGDGAVADTIRLDGISFWGKHGVYDYERRDGQRFEVDLTVSFPLGVAGASDALADTVDYTELAGLVVEVGSSRSFLLVERLAHELVAAILARWPWLHVALTLRKFPKDMPGEPRSAQVTIVRGPAAGTGIRG